MAQIECYRCGKAIKGDYRTVNDAGQKGRDAEHNRIVHPFRC